MSLSLQVEMSGVDAVLADFTALPAQIQKAAQRAQTKASTYAAGRLAALVAERLGQEAFQRFFKVAVVRNPYDLTVSRYYWSHRKEGNTSPAHFRSWLLTRPEILRKNFNITHIDGTCAVDFMMRYENLKDDVTSFARKVGLPDTLFDEFSALKAKGHYRPKAAKTSELFAGFDEGKAVVAEIFAPDIADFGYTCP